MAFITHASLNPLTYVVFADANWGLKVDSRDGTDVGPKRNILEKNAAFWDVTPCGSF
jgi:hypothetical protein